MQDVRLSFTLARFGKSALLRLAALILLPAQFSATLPIAFLVATAQAQETILATAAVAPDPGGPAPDAATLAREEQVLMPKLTALRPALPEGQGRILPEFSAEVPDAELAAVRILPEPLVPFGDTVPEDNQALAKALRSYVAGANRDDTSHLTGYLQAFPESPWRVSILVGLGRQYASTGFMTKAINAYRSAWELSRKATDLKRRLLADAAVAGLADLTARVNRRGELQALLLELEGREVLGAAREIVANARLRLPPERPEAADSGTNCGIYALEQIHRSVRGSARVPTILKSRKERLRLGLEPAGKSGFSVHQLHALGKIAGIDARPGTQAKDEAVIPIPSVIHWKFGHFSAVTKREGDRYKVKDPMLGGEMWLSAAALREEGSGVFLIVGTALPDGWRSLSTEQAASVIGGQPTVVIPHKPNPCDKQTASCATGSCVGMPRHSVHKMQASLLIKDSPVAYTPARGPDMTFTLTYMQRGTQQAQSPQMGNVGRQWSHNWVGFVDARVVIGFPAGYTVEDATVVRGGSEEKYEPVNREVDLCYPGTAHYLPNTKDQTRLVQVSGPAYEPCPISDPPPPNPEPCCQLVDNPAPRVYERLLPDGTVERYGFEHGGLVLLSSITHRDGSVTSYTYDSQARLTQMGGMRIFYDDPADPMLITSILDPFGRTANLEYNEMGQLVRIVDAVGMSSELAYGPGDFINTLITPYGTTRFEFGETYGGSPVRWIETTDALGAKERVETHFNNLPAGGLAPADDVPQGWEAFNNDLGRNFTYFWSKKAMMDAPGQIESAEYTRWLQDYDSGTLLAIPSVTKQPLEGRVWHRYPDQDPDLEEGPWHYAFTTANPVATARVLDDGTTQTRHSEYSALGQVTKTSDPVGRETLYDYVGVDLSAVRQKNGAGHNTLVQYQDYDNPNAGGANQHQPRTIIDAAGQVTRKTFNADGQPLTSSRERMHGSALVTETTTYVYYNSPGTPSHQRLKEIRGPANELLGSFTYDAMGRVLTQADEDSYTRTFAYDNLDRLLRVTYPDGTYAQTIYNRLDPEWQRDRAGRWTRTYYDALQRVIGVQDPAGRLTQFEQCPCGALEAIVDAKGNRTSFNYDGQTRGSEKMYPDPDGAGPLQPEVIQYRYGTKSGQLSHMIDAKAQRTNFTYYADGALASVSYTAADGTTALVPPTPSVSYTYHPAYSRVASVTTSGVEIKQYTYHPVAAGNLGAGRLQYEDTYDAAVPGVLLSRVEHAYDEYGRELSCAIDGAVEARTFDGLGRIATSTNPLGSFTYGYLGATGRLDHVNYPNGQRTEYRYHPAVAVAGNGNGDLRLSQIKNTTLIGATLYSHFDYEYDKTGNITSWKQAQGAGPAKVHGFGYDLADQLLSATVQPMGSATPEEQFEYRYDASGNRQTEQRSVAAAGGGYTTTLTTDTHNALNQITARSGGSGPLVVQGTMNEAGSITVGGLDAKVKQQSDGSYRFEATVPVQGGANSVPIVATDASGNNNQTSKAVQFQVSGVAIPQLTYDRNGNTLSDGSRTYEWDAVNRLVGINYAAGGKTVFSYNGLGQRIAESEYPAGGAPATSMKRLVWCGLQLREERTAANAVTTRFFPQGVHEIDPAQTPLWAPYFYTRDHLGSIRELSDGSGAIRAQYAYDSWGQRNKLGGDKDVLKAFTGHPLHQRSGLHLAYYRAYDGRVGRWLNTDPLGEHDGANLLRYVWNNPLNAADPYGLRTLSLTYGADTSYTGDVHKEIKKQADCLKDILAKCCKKWNKACGVNVESTFSRAVPNLPPGGYDMSSVIRQTTGTLGGEINIIFTDDLPGRGIGRSQDGVGVILEKGAACRTLAHELGHHAGYRDYKNAGDVFHSSASGNLMSGTYGGSDVDECYCQVVDLLAK